MTEHKIRPRESYFDDDGWECEYPAQHPLRIEYRAVRPTVAGDELISEHRCLADAWEAAAEDGGPGCTVRVVRIRINSSQDGGDDA